MLVNFANSSLYSIAAHASDCRESTVINWAYFYCALFDEASYPWAAAVAFFRI